MGIVLASELIGLLTGVGRLVVLQWIDVRGSAAQDLAQASDFSVACSGIFEVAAVVACVIAFSMWFHRVYRNLPALGATNLAITPARAVGSFYIPFVNLIQPYEAMTEIWLHSQLPAADPLLESAEDPRPMKVWWLSFLASNIVGNVGAFLLRGAETVSKLRWATVAMLLSDGLAIVAALAAMFLVRQISAHQDALNKHLQAQRVVPAQTEAPTSSSEI